MSELRTTRSERTRGREALTPTLPRHIRIGLTRVRIKCKEPGSARRTRLLIVVLLGFGIGLFIRPTMAEDTTVASSSLPAPESREDAWWTGPLLASSAATLPQGHLLIEPYLYDSVAVGRFDGNGYRTAEPHEATVGSLAYFIYGVTDRVSIGIIPRFAYRNAPGAAGSSGFGTGDFSVQAQYRLTDFLEEHRVPTISIIAIESLPTGKYERLDVNSGSALGSGAYTSTLALYSQYYFWLPTGRILRTRLNVGYAWSSSVAITGSSVYGTPGGFSGLAQPGQTATFDAALEYSVTRNWVLALDILGERDDNTHINGRLAGPTSGSYVADMGSSQMLVFAPAVEFNWNAHVGLILGSRVVGMGRNTTQTIAAVAALNMVF